MYTQTNKNEGMEKVILYVESSCGKFLLLDNWMHFVYYANSRGGKIIKNASKQELIITKVAASIL